MQRPIKQNDVTMAGISAPARCVIAGALPLGGGRVTLPRVG
jgi:hypothetical protein